MLLYLVSRLRYNNFLQMMSTGGRFWNRQYIDFLFEVSNSSITDPLELASMVTVTSPRGESLCNLGTIHFTMLRLHVATSTSGLATLW